jgi:hypothetical protein
MVSGTVSSSGAGNSVLIIGLPITTASTTQQVLGHGTVDEDTGLNYAPGIVELNDAYSIQFSFNCSFSGSKRFVIQYDYFL